MMGPSKFARFAILHVEGPNTAQSPCSSPVLTRRRGPCPQLLDYDDDWPAVAASQSGHSSREPLCPDEEDDEATSAAQSGHSSPEEYHSPLQSETEEDNLVDSSDELKAVSDQWLQTPSADVATSDERRRKWNWRKSSSRS